MTARFVSFEGGEGAGKSTQAALLAERLRSTGREVVLTREPGGTPAGEAVRGLLLTGAAERWSARSEVLLLAAARREHVECVIRPALARGAWVVCDRYIDSTRAYQGGAGGVPDAAIMAVHEFATAGLLPDRTLLLTVPAVIAAERMRERGSADRMEAKGQAYHDALTARFDELAKNDPQRFRVLSSGCSVADTAKACWDALGDLV